MEKLSPVRIPCLCFPKLSLPGLLLKNHSTSWDGVRAHVTHAPLNHALARFPVRHNAVSQAARAVLRRGALHSLPALAAAAGQPAPAGGVSRASTARAVEHSGAGWRQGGCSTGAAGAQPQRRLLRGGCRLPPSAPPEPGLCYCHTQHSSCQLEAGRVPGPLPLLQPIRQLQQRPEAAGPGKPAFRGAGRARALWSMPGWPHSFTFRHGT